MEKILKKILDPLKNGRSAGYGDTGIDIAEAILRDCPQKVDVHLRGESCTSGGAAYDLTISGGLFNEGGWGWSGGYNIRLTIHGSRPQKPWDRPEAQKCLIAKISAVGDKSYQLEVASLELSGDVWG